MPGLPVPVAAAVAALRRAGIGWLLLRGDPVRPSGDLDLLVAPADGHRLDAVLGDAGFVRRRAPEHRPHRLYVRRAPSAPGGAPRWWVLDVLDVVEPVGAGSRPLPIAAELIARSHLGPDGIRRPDPVDAAWLELVRACRPGAPEPSAVLAHGLGPGGSPVPVSLDQVRPGVSRRLTEAATGSADPTAVLAEVRDALRPDRGAFRAALRRAGSVVGRPRDRAGVRGVSLAVLGPDGAGKSTLVDGLVAALPLATKVHYLGVFRTSERETLLRRVPGIALAGRLTKLRSRSLRGALDVRRGRIVLYDRHVVDAMLRPGVPSFRSRVSYSLLERSCPPPDLFVVLDGPGALMYERKGEHSAEVLEERRQRYLELPQRYDSVAVVDATLPADEVRAHVEDLVWELYRRHET